MVQSVLEMTKDLVIAHLETYHLSSGKVVRMLERTHATLLLLQRKEETVGRAPTPAPGDWQQSITRLAIACLECGASLKQLSVRHLQKHGLDAHSYRVKHGMPRTQPLSAKDTTVRRKQTL
jgi:predicted transcriptional regulator